MRDEGRGGRFVFKDFTFGMFVEVCYVFSLVRADCFGADAMTHHVLFTVDLRKGAVRVPLPVDLITVYLQHTNMLVCISS